MAGTRVQDELLALAQHDHEAPGAHERTPALDDQLQHVLQRNLSADRNRHITGRLQPPEGLLRLLAPALAGLIQPGVLNRDRRPIGKNHSSLLVGLCELATRLLGQVQVAPRLPADHDRHAQEAAHRRMPRREPVAARMLAHVGEAQRLRMLDQRTKNTSSARQVPDRPVGRLIDARCQELLKRTVLLVQDPKRGIARPSDLPCGLEDAVQHDALVELCRQGAAYLQQAANQQPFGDLAHQHASLGEAPIWRSRRLLRSHASAVSRQGAQAMHPSSGPPHRPAPVTVPNSHQVLSRSRLR